MSNTGILRTTENASSTQNAIKSEQKVPRLKTKALGDVQNTLHSRPGNFANPITNSAVKARPGKIQSHVKLASNENCFSNSSSRKKVNVTPSKSAVKSLLTTPVIEKDVFETHHHILCEEDQQAYLNDYFSEFKFSEEQITNLVRSVRICVSPLSIPFYEPCKDIELPHVEKCEDSFSINDVLNDIIIPAIPPVQ